jgi:hypothetical protein
MANPRLAVGLTVMILSEYVAAAFGAARGGMSGSIGNIELPIEKE